MSINIVPLSKEHIPLLAEVKVRAFQGPPWYEPWTAERSQMTLELISQYPESLAFTALVDDRPVGLAIGHKEIDYEKDGLYIQEIFVDPDFQKKGIGNALLKKLIDECKKKGLLSMYLITHGRSYLPAFYKKHGFITSDSDIIMYIE